MIKNLFVTSIVLLSNVQVSYAGESGDKYGGHHEKVEGLPQLDPTYFASQAFWLAVVFLFMYLVFSAKSLPAISGTIEDRSERIKNDLESAERIKKEVEDVQTAYEESLENARSESAQLFQDIEKEIKTKTEDQMKEFSEKSSDMIEKLEKEINKARKKTMNEMSEVAASIAADAAEKIIGVRENEEKAKDIVQTLNKAA